MTEAVCVCGQGLFPAKDLHHLSCLSPSLQDAALIVQVLESEDYNIESTIFAVLQMNEVKRLCKYPRPASFFGEGCTAQG